MSQSSSTPSPNAVPNRKVSEMSEHTRRNFLRTSVGAAAVGAAAAVVPFGNSAQAAPATDSHPLDSGPAHAGSFHVWVKDADAGKIAVLVGESEVVYTDRRLAKRLARIAARAQS